MDLNYFELIRRSKSLDLSSCTEALRVAILADAATQQLVSLLKVLFAERGVRIEAWEAPFDAMELQVYDPGSALYAFAPDVILLLGATQALRGRYYKRPSSGARTPARRSCGPSRCCARSSRSPAPHASRWSGSVRPVPHPTQSSRLPG